MMSKKVIKGLSTRRRVKDAHKQRQQQLKVSSKDRKKFKTLMSGRVN